MCAITETFDLIEESGVDIYEDDPDFGKPSPHFIHKKLGCEVG